MEGRVERGGLRPRDAAYVLGAFWAVAVVVFGVLERLVDPKTFHSVWLGMWWAVETVTTAGYGDIIPKLRWTSAASSSWGAHSGATEHLATTQMLRMRRRLRTASRARRSAGDCSLPGCPGEALAMRMGITASTLIAMPLILA